jgi:hypothetical protein
MHLSGQPPKAAQPASHELTRRGWHRKSQFAIDVALLASFEST